MKVNKKALETHILVLVIISAIMTALIISVFSAFFKNDHQNCQNFEFEISRKCVDGNSLKVNVRNTGNSLINFKSNGAFSREYQVPIGKEVAMEFGVRELEVVDVIPFVKSVTTDEEFNCKGKTESVQLSRLIKCS